MEPPELLTRLSELEGETARQAILALHRELLTPAFIKQGVQQVGALIKERRHTSALQLAADC